MNKKDMIEELVEFEFNSVTLVEVVQLYIKLQREFLDASLTEDEVLSKYNDLFGDAEVVH
ncbi:MAG: hypothetical protein CMJ25_09710 [Phycisphaerae bacterium]|nr:hypothetical protein [Phycisphaerae bacterium]